MSGVMRPGVPDSLVCGMCRGPRARVRGALLCLACDGPAHEQRAVGSR